MSLVSDATAAYERAGPRQLANQPARAKKSKTQSAASPWGQYQAKAQSRIAYQISNGFSWMNHYSLLETYLLPRRGIFINPTIVTPNQQNRGAAINQAILDPTGTQAMRICAAGMMGGLMSPGRPWFKLKPAMGERESLGEEAELWFEEVEDRMYQVMARSNFYDSGAQMFEDLTTFGTAPVIIYEDEQDIIRCYNPCPGEYRLSVGGTFRVNCLTRLFVMTTNQMIDFFTLENCPGDVQSLWQTKGSGLEIERIVAHIIEPNFPIDGVGNEDIYMVPSTFTWREMYWCWGMASDRPLSKRGFKDQPFVCPRWATTSNDPYGRSAGMDALPDIMQLQVETARKAEAIEKLVRPPMLASMEMKNEPSSILPGHVTYVASLAADKGMRPTYTVQPQVEHMMKDLMEIQARIKRGFFNDLFLMLETTGSDRMTAYEVAQKMQEKLQVLGPVTERWHNEFASPAIKRIFRIMERKRLLPPLPEALQNQALAIDYVSAMALAQRASATASQERFAAVTGNLSAIYPEAKFKLNALNFLDEYADQLGVSKRVVNSNDVAMKGYLDLVKQQQAQQLGQEAMALTEGAKNLAATDVGGGVNALSMLMGGPGGLA